MATLFELDREIGAPGPLEFALRLMGAANHVERIGDGLSDGRLRTNSRTVEREQRDTATDEGSQRPASWHHGPLVPPFNNDKAFSGERSGFPKAAASAYLEVAPLD